MYTYNGITCRQKEGLVEIKIRWHAAAAAELKWIGSKGKKEECWREGWQNFRKLFRNQKERKKERESESVCLCVGHCSTATHQTRAAAVAAKKVEN